MNRLLIAILLSVLTSTSAQAQQHKLWYSQPARHWLEALPVGNSHLGAMVYGKTAKTKKAIVTLTEDSKEITIFEGL